MQEALQVRAGADRARPQEVERRRQRCQRPAQCASRSDAAVRSHYASCCTCWAPVTGYLLNAAVFELVAEVRCGRCRCSRGRDGDLHVRQRGSPRRLPKAITAACTFHVDCAHRWRDRGWADAVLSAIQASGIAQEWCEDSPLPRRREERRLSQKGFGRGPSPHVRWWGKLHAEEPK